MSSKKMEEGHVDWAERQRAQIEQMNMKNYLVNQIGGVASMPSTLTTWGCALVRPCVEN